jgi:predicted nucleic acid binding AN1-type Zn finger protein
LTLSIEHKPSTTAHTRLRMDVSKRANSTTHTLCTRTKNTRVNTGKSDSNSLCSCLTTHSSLYNQTWAATYATNDGQWRGDDHYTIRSSYIASNAANPGVCPTAAPVPAQCTNRAIRLCCLNIAPWATNSGVWGGICGYTPSNPSELIGARCIPRPATGSCPAGTSQACCAGTVPGQCALGTQCARV